MKYCKHCNKPVTDKFRKGFGFIYHLKCYIKIYGWNER